MCDVRKLFPHLVCKSQAEDIGISTPDNRNSLVWVCKNCYLKIADMPWPWDVEEKNNKDKSTIFLRR